MQIPLFCFFCTATSLCLLLISSAQSNDVILSPRGRKWSMYNEKTLPYVWFKSEQCAINFFVKETMHDLFKLCSLYSYRWFLFISMALGGVVGWALPVVAASTLLHYSVWIPVIVLLFDCRRALPVDWPLLQQLGFPAWLPLLVTHQAPTTDHFWWTAFNELDKTI